MEKRKGLTPFQYALVNVSRMKFKCDAKFIPEYKRALTKVFKRLDRYFTEKNLYNLLDYWPVVDRLIESDFCFDIDDSMSTRNWAGYHQCGPDGWASKIAMHSEYMGKMTETEGVLCHELFHFLTTGQKVLNYVKDGKKVQLSGNRKTWSDEHGGYGMTTPSGDIAVGGFFTEGWTELAKQEVYSEKESYHSYPPQTEFVRFLDRLTSLNFSIEEYLMKDIEKYSVIRNFSIVHDCCQIFQKEFEKNNKIDYKTNEHYLQAQDWAVKGVLKNITLQKIQDKKQIIKTISAILEGAPSYHGGRKEKYRKEVEIALEIYLQDALGKDKVDPQHIQLLIETAQKQGKLDNRRVALSDNTKFEVSYNPHQFWYNGSKVCGFDKIMSIRDSKISIKVSGANISLITDWTGHSITMEAITETGEKDSIQININPENNNDISLPQQKRRIDIAKYNKFLQRDVDTQTNLLLHYEIKEDMQKIVDEIGAGKVQNMKIVTLESGEKYLVATTIKDAFFYQIVGGKCKKVPVKTKKKVDDSISVSDKFYTSRGKGALVGYNNTGIVADENDTLYELENGLTLTSYFADGENFAPAYPFGDSGHLIGERRPCDEVYNVGNKVVANIFKKQTNANEDEDEQTK